MDTFNFQNFIKEKRLIYKLGKVPSVPSSGAEDVSDVPLPAPELSDDTVGQEEGVRQEEADTTGVPAVGEAMKFGIESAYPIVSTNEEGREKVKKDGERMRQDPLIQKIFQYGSEVLGDFRIKSSIDFGEYAPHIISSESIRSNAVLPSIIKPGKYVPLNDALIALIDQAVEEKGLTVEGEGTDLFKAAELMTEKPKEAFKINGISQEKLDTLSDSEKMQRTLFEIFSIKTKNPEKKSERFNKITKKRNDIIEQSIKKIPKDRLEIMYKTLDGMEEGEREKMLNMLSENADVISHLSPKGFEACMGLFTAESSADRIKILSTLSRHDQKRIRENWPDDLSKMGIKFLEDVDGQVNKKREGERKEREKAEIVEAESNELNDALTNPNVPQEKLEKATLNYLESLNIASEEGGYGSPKLSEEEQIEENNMNFIKNSAHRSIDMVLADLDVEDVDAKKAELLQEKNAEQEQVNIKLMQSGIDMRDAEKQLNFAKKQLEYEKNNNNNQDEIYILEENIERIEEKVDTIIYNRGKLANTYETNVYAIGYLEDMDSFSENALINKLNKITKEFLDEFNLENQSKLGKFDFEVRWRGKDELLPAIVISNKQEEDAYFKKLFGEEKVIYVDRSMIEKVKVRMEEMKAEKK